MRTAALLSKKLTTLLCLGTALAQSPPITIPIGTGLDTHPVTAEDVLSIREVRDPPLSPDGKQVAFSVREPADRWSLVGILSDRGESGVDNPEATTQIYLVVAMAVRLNG